MKKRNLFTGLLALGLFGLVGCQEEAASSTALPSVSVPTTTPSVSVPTTTPSTNIPSTTPSTTVPSTTVPSTTPSTTIPLEPYYNGLDTSTSGRAFIDKLSIIINRGVNKRTYKQVYNDLTVTDVDPNNPDNIVCFYTGVSYPKGTNGNDRKWNREHTWAKAHGFNKESYPAYSDLQHLRATEMDINNKRGNLDFDEVENHGGASSSDKYGNKWNSTCFEPRDEVKGDVARIMFYMTVKYSSGSLKLSLVDEVPTTTGNGVGKFGSLSTLLKWHEEDPVDEMEMARHERIYNIQKNRNPFIDHPEFVNNVFKNEGSSQSVDQAKVNNVKSLIDALADTITLDDKTAVNAAKSAYDLLNGSEKDLVTNYSKLEAAIERIKVLEEEPTGPGKPDSSINPVVPNSDAALEIDFTKNPYKEKIEYATNTTITMGTYDFFFSSIFAAQETQYPNYLAPACIRLGGRSTISLEALGLADTGHYMESMFDMEGLTKLDIKFKTAGKGYDSWEVLFKETGSSTYTSVGEGTNTNAVVNLPSAKNGRFVLIIKGASPRCDILSYKLYK